MPPAIITVVGRSWGRKTTSAPYTTSAPAAACATRRPAGSDFSAKMSRVITAMAATFITDYSGIALRHAVGIDNLMWSSDYPHHGNDWPYSRKTIEDMMGHIPRDERAKIVGGNAVRIFNLED